MALREKRQQIAKETQRLTPGIIRSTAGASADSDFYTALLPPLQQNKEPKDTRVRVEYGDTFTIAQKLVAAGHSKVAVLNMASDRNPGGGWLRGALAQEEALCLRSTLAATLKPAHYPTPPLGATWSPGVVVFRDEVHNFCRMFEENDRFVVGVVSMAALRRPPLTEDELDYRFPKDTELMKDKIRQTLRLMASNTVSGCVLGALGCGVFCNPPKRVAQLFRGVILEDEFRGHFDEIVFAILDRKREGNVEAFQDIIGDFVIRGEPTVGG